MGFMRFGLDFSRFGDDFFATKEIPWRVRNRMLDKIFLDNHDFHFFLQHVSLTYIS